jgi:hypothetical protein
MNIIFLVFLVFSFLCLMYDVFAVMVAVFYAGTLYLNGGLVLELELHLEICSMPPHKEAC